MKYVIGVDGGNTKADFALLDETGNFLDGLRSGTCSHEAFDDDFDIAREKINACVSELLERNSLKISDISGAAFGLAGADFPHQIRELTTRIESLGIKKFILANDSFLGIKSAAKKGYGVCSINGTGTVAGGVDINGRFLQVSGMGLTFGDEAGGSYIAGRGVRLAYDYMYRCGEYTILADTLPKLFGLNGGAGEYEFFAESYVLRDRDKIKAHDIINLMYDAASEGDKPCLAELERIGGQLAMSAAGCVRALDFSGCDEIDVIMAGSVWAKSKKEFIHDAFKRKMTELTGRKLNFIKLTSPPVVGAALWALEIGNGVFPDDLVREKVSGVMSGASVFA